MMKNSTVWVKNIIFVWLAICTAQWLMSFMMYFGAGFLLLAVFSVLGNTEVNQFGLLLPHIATLALYALGVTYYLFPICVSVYFFKTIRKQPDQGYPVFWMLAAVVLSGLLNFFIYLDFFVFNLPRLEHQRAMLVWLEWHYFAPHQNKQATAMPELLPIGNYLASCSGCVVQHKQLRCHCFSKSGTLQNSQLNLAQLQHNDLPLQNCDGQLTQTAFCPE
jgi:hypothetical protein